MKPRRIIESVTTREGTELVLIERGETFLLEVDGEALMSSQTSGSEEVLAQVVISRLQPRGAPHLLIGGLGMGFTLRAALDGLDSRPRARIDIVEVFEPVIRWNRGVLANLAGRPLDDPRVTVKVDDVSETIKRSRDRYDAILLDVDNGPEGLTLASNQRLYGPNGLRNLREALTPNGVLGIWSASDDRPFRRAMERAGFDLEVVRTRARAGGRGQRHAIFLGLLRDGAVAGP